jgi:hypothetical protein
MYSSCCGVFVNADALDYQRCPSCKESCDFTDGSEEETIEYITIKMPSFKWQSMASYFELIHNVDYTVKEIDPNDGKFDNDPIHQELKKASNKSFKALKEYEWKTRNK